MSDSAEIVLTFSVRTCQPDQFMSDSAEILIFTQSNSLQRIGLLSDTFRQVCSVENHPTFRRNQTGLLCGARSNIFIRVMSYQVNK
jgi:hypothetical protein